MGLIKQGRLRLPFTIEVRMLVKNIRTGVTAEVSEQIAKFLIGTGKCVEVKPEKKAEKEEKKPVSKKTYKTKDLKAEA